MLLNLCGNLETTQVKNENARKLKFSKTEKYPPGLAAGVTSQLYVMWYLKV